MPDCVHSRVKRRRRHEGVPLHTMCTLTNKKCHVSVSKKKFKKKKGQKKKGQKKRQGLRGKISDDDKILPDSPTMTGIVTIADLIYTMA